MEIIKIDNIQADELPFDFTELNKQANIDKQKENPAGYSATVTPCDKEV